MWKFVSHSLNIRSNSVKILSRKLSASEECSKSAFAKVKIVPPIEIFHLTKLYREDTHKNKVNLGVGAYLTEENEPFVFPVVKKCELEVVKDCNLNHEYLPMLGNPDFTHAATELILGKDCKAMKERRFVASQSLSGTGAIRLAAEFMCIHMKRRVCFIPDPTWENHNNIFKMVGFKQIKSYPYWNSETRKVDIAKILSALCTAPEGAVVLLQASGHNPTGMDPTKKQWKQIAQVIKYRKLFPFFDAAYQGFATGNPDQDAWAIRHFVKEGIETLIAQSFAKNMGLYNERIGNLIIVLNNKEFIPAVASQLAILVRLSYSNPPAFGSRVVAKLLTSEENRCEWLKTIGIMTERIKQMRKALADKLVELKTPGTWDHIVRQCGLFSYTGLNAEQCQKLIKEKHIYLLKTGRINICGLNTKNVDYVAKSINEVVKDAVGKGKGNDGECLKNPKKK